MTEFERRAAVIDTSFWTAGYRAEIVANCLDLFEIVVPGSVEAEIRWRSASLPRREYPYATLFRHLRSKMSGPPADNVAPIRMFGRGEAEAISLASHLRVDLLINEFRGARYASGHGI